MQRAHHPGAVEFSIKDTTADKVKELMATRKHEGIITPAQASKVRGICTFAAQIECGRVGKAPVRSLKDRSI